MAWERANDEAVRLLREVPGRLGTQLCFLLEIDRLKTVLRRNRLLADDRRENDAEHSWHLAMMVLVLAEHADEPIDVARTLELVLVHDLVEIIAGDTFIYDEAASRGQAEREREAAEQLFALLPDDQRDGFRDRWDEFEARRTPEARFAKAVDRLQPVLLNFVVGGGTWHRAEVDHARVHHHQRVIADASGTLWHQVERLLEAAVEHGWLREGP